MAENGKLYELVAELLVEQRNTVSELKQMRGDFNSQLTGLSSRVDRLEDAQRTTNLLLQQHSRDLMKIAELLEKHVVHWGDKVQVGTPAKRIVGNIVKVK